MEQKRLHNPAETAGCGQHKTPRAVQKNGSKLLVEGSWLFNQFEERLVERNMDLLRLRPTAKIRIVANMADETWLNLNEKSKLANRMMKDRIPILEEMYAQFYGCSAVLGWDEKIKKDIADTLMPFLDIGERTCYTYYGHNYRSMLYAEILLDYRGVAGVEKASIMLGTLLHDAGKAGVPGEILRKEGKPNLEEANRLKKHTRYGRDIVKNTARLCAPPRSIIRSQMDTIADVAFSHQEKFCGEGYPRGKVGDEISMGARIAAFCDAIDAMTSKRLYQTGTPKTFELARTIAFAEMNRHFNKNIVTDFFRAVDEVTGLKDRIYSIIRSCGGNPE